MTRSAPVPPSAVAVKALTAYNSRRRRWLTDPIAAESDSLPVGLNPPSESQVADDPDAIRAWVRAWREHEGAGDVEWVTRRWPSFGTQDVPIRVLLPGANVIAAAAGRAKQWHRLLTRRAQLVALGDSGPDEPSPNLDGGAQPPVDTDETARTHDGPPPLDAAVAATATAWDGLDDTDFDRLLAALRWLRDHPASGLLIRQLPVPGVDTKWVARHRGLLESLLTGIRGDGDLGVRTLPRLLDVAILDRTLLPGTPRVFATSVEELAAMPLRPRVVLLLENKEGVHALPDLPGVVAVHGGGYAVHELAAVPWLAGADVRYWGDLDTHGFAILDRLRTHLPGVRSLLMDTATLEVWRELAVPEPSPTTADPTHLTADESDTLAALRAGNLRLEQERIPWPYALAALTDTTDTGRVQ